MEWRSRGRGSERGRASPGEPNTQTFSQMLMVELIEGMFFVSQEAMDLAATT